ncbi:MAG: hypothetical protein RI985_230 [Chloroflexota bacterium]|jgi:hypothetical protein
MRMLLALLCVMALMPYTGGTAEAATKTCSSAGYKCVFIKAKFNVASGDSIVGTSSKLTGFTFLVTSKTGQVLLRKKFTSNPTTTLTLRTSPIRLVGGKVPAGMSFHLINKDGTYYGPVITSWSGTQRTKATLVSTSMNTLATNRLTINLGTLTFKTKASRQGYGYTTTKIPLSSTSTVVATAGIPKGIGTYGRQSNTVRLRRALAITASEMTDGADADKDGIINAFDINDDGANGDNLPDYQDTTMLTPSIGSANCEAAASFTMFSNFKATAGDFTGTINDHSTETDYEASPAKIQNALQSTLTFAIQPITSVCGSAVVKTEFTGLSVPYAPSSHQTLCDNDSGTSAPTCSSVNPDWQWTPGNGNVQAGGTSFTIATGSAFACTTSKCNISGQDVFVQLITTANGNTYEFTTSPTFVFVTHPMLKSFYVSTDSTCSTTESAYISVLNYATTPIDASQTQPIVISSAANQLVCVRIHRPQRFATLGETGWSTGELYDIGKLQYYPDIPNAIGSSSGGGGPGRCDGMLQSDTKADAQSSTVTSDFYTLAWSTADLKSCFEDRSRTWTTGTLDIDIQVVAPVQYSGNAAQKIYFDIQ